MNTISEEEYEEMYKQYLSGRSLSDVAQEHKMSAPYLRHKFLERGWKTYTKKEQWAMRIEKIKQKIKDAFASGRKFRSKNEFARELGVSVSTMKKYLKELNLDFSDVEKSPEVYSSEQNVSTVPQNI